jgi:hypothetical protein
MFETCTTHAAKAEPLADVVDEVVVAIGDIR